MANLALWSAFAVARLVAVAPSVQFLGDAIVFETMVVSIAVPLGTDVVARIYEKYHSNIVSMTFLRTRTLWWLIPTALTNIFFAVIQKAFLGDHGSQLDRFASWVCLFGFIAAAVLMTVFVFRVVLYSAEDASGMLRRLKQIAVKELRA